MEGVGWITVRWLRSRGAAVAPIALLVALGTAGSVVALAAADHTAGAYRGHLERGRVGHVIINPGIHSAEIDEVIRDLPGVEHVTVTSFFTVTVDEGRSRSRRDAEADGWDALVQGSSDGAHIESDLAVLTSGRLPTGPAEMVVSDPEAAGLRLGDEVDLAFWASALLEQSFPGDYEEYLDEVIEPVGTERVTVVGTATVPSAILPDSQYPGVRAILSPDLARRYSCPPVEVRLATASLEEVVAAYRAVPCASNYSYYSLRLAGGDGAVAATLDAFNRAADRLDPDGDAPSGITYSLFPTESRQERERVEHAIRPTVTALGALGAAGVATTVLVAALAAARELRQVAPVSARWHRLGMPTRSRALVAAGPIIVALVGGLALGTAAGIWFDVGALGSVRPMAPGPIRGLVVASALGVVAIALSTVVVVLVLAVRTARSVATPPPRGRGATDVPGGARPDGERRPVAHRWLLARSPAAARGLRMAASHRTSGPAVAGAGVLSALMVATVVFGASLVALLDEPRSYGWPWDVAATINGGYYGPSAEEADAVFGSDPDVARWTGMVPVTDVALDATAVGAVAGLDRTSHVDLPVIEGSLPVGRDEVAIGSTTARVLGLGVDDQVELTRRGIPGHRVTVTGIVVLPTVRALNADGVSAGTGVLLPEAALPDDGSWTVSFIGLSLRDADDAAAVGRLLGRLGPQPGTTDFVFTYSEPVAPPEVLDARATLGLPVAVAGVFGLATAAGLAAASWASSHARRSELAVLRALGFTTGQVRSTVRAHALVTASMVVAVGVPVGVILGRVLWRAYAVRLGVATDPSSPLVLVLLTSLAIIVIALVVAEPIARRAATVTSGVRPQT